MDALKARKQYELAHWGIPPTRETPVDAPGMKVKQALWALGKLRTLVFLDGSILRTKRPYPYLAVGERDNRIYFVGEGELEMSRAGKWGPVGSRRQVTRIDYDAFKGDETKLVYWYHEHEPPYPTLYIASDKRPRYEGGGYYVRAEGIHK